MAADINEVKNKQVATGEDLRDIKAAIFGPAHDPALGFATRLKVVETRLEKTISELEGWKNQYRGASLTIRFLYVAITALAGGLGAAIFSIFTPK